MLVNTFMQRSDMRMVTETAVSWCVRPVRVATPTPAEGTLIIRVVSISEAKGDFKKICIVNVVLTLACSPEHSKQNRCMHLRTPLHCFFAEPPCALATPTEYP